MVENKEVNKMLTTARLQDTTNRQNSIEIENDPNIQMDAKTVELITDWQRRQHGVINQAKGLMIGR